MITISRGTSCADGKRQSQSRAGRSTSVPAFNPRNKLDEIAFSFLEGVGTIRTPLNLYPTRAVSTERHAKRRA
jgi:hypothetical protein